MAKVSNKLKDNIMPVVIFVGILVICAVVGLGEMNADNFGWMIAFLLGLVNVIWFRRLGRFYYEGAKGLPTLIPLPEKWEILFCQAFTLFVGGVFVAVSALKLLLQIF